LHYIPQISYLYFPVSVILYS